MTYCLRNRLKELFVNLLISPCQILPTAENRWRHCKQSTHMVAWTGLWWTKWTKSFTYVQFLLTKHACDESNIVPCIGENS